MSAWDLAPLALLIPVTLPVVELDAGVDLQRPLRRFVFVVFIVLIILLRVDESRGKGLWVDLFLNHNLSDVAHGVTHKHITIQMDNRIPSSETYSRALPPTSKCLKASCNEARPLASSITCITACSTFTSALSVRF